MLTAVFPKLEKAKFVQILRAFYRSYWYLAAVAALMAVSELFALELPIYYLYLALTAGCLLFGEDMLGLVPLVCSGYMTFSASNNPSLNAETSVFTTAGGFMQLGFILATVVVLIAGRLAVCHFELPKKRIPALTVGFCALGLSYVLGGVASSAYAWNTALFGLVQIIALAFFYFIFYYGVDWRRVKKEYLAALVLALGFGMVLETVGMYFRADVFVAGQVVRDHLYTGWGVYNNVGCIMAMCLPAPFYFAATKKRGWVFAVIGCIFMLSLLLTQSRGAILFGTLVFAGCVIFTLVRARGRQKLWNGVVFGAFAVVAVVGGLVLRGYLAPLFTSLVKDGFEDAGRLEIYRKCWEAFLSSPPFGVGFYKTPGAMLTESGALQFVEAPAGAFLPPRAHNTILQLLASGGAVALAAYLVHRTQTLVLFFRKPSAEKIFVFLSVAALLLTSLLDCHFFNFGPAILYSVLLVFAECTDPNRRLYKEKKKAA